MRKDQLRMFPPYSLSFRFEQSAQLGLRITVFVAVILASAFLAPRASLHEVLIMIALVVGFVGLVSLMCVPALSLLILVVCCLVVPFSIGTGTDSPLNAAVLVLIPLTGLWIVEMIWSREGRLRFSRSVFPLLALILVAMLSFALGVQPEIPFAETAPLRAQLGGLAIFGLSAAAFLLAGHQLRDVRWLERLTWLFLGLGGIYVAGRAVSKLGAYTDRVFQSGADGSVFWVWLVALAFGQAAFNRRLSRPVRLALAAIVVVAFYVGFFENRDWKSGWVPPLVAIAIVLWAGSPRLALPLTLLGGAVTAIGGSAVTNLFLESESYDILTRTAAWDTLISVIKVNPVLGTGPANYYWYTPLFSILGYHVRFNSHNNYVDLIAQVGFVGLICFLWFAWEIGRLGVGLRRRARPGFAQAYVYGALGGLVGTLAAGMLGDWFLPFVYNIGLDGFRASVLGWIFLGGLLALDRFDHLDRLASASRESPLLGKDPNGIPSRG